LQKNLIKPSKMEKLDQWFWEGIITMFLERIHLTEKLLIFMTEAVLQQIWRFIM
jgi:hypothetical protein